VRNESEILVPVDKGSLTGRAAVFALALGLVVITLTVPVRSWFDQRASIAALEAEVAATRAVVAEQEVMQERWNDPAFIVAEARRRLHFLLPGEIGYTTLGADGLPIAEQVSNPEPVRDLPWYETLWGAVQAADKP